jgi:hypothetical protein
MKRSDMAWIEHLARHVGGKNHRQVDAAQAVVAAVNGFLDDLCAIMSDYSSYFNELVQPENPEAMLRVFRLGSTRPGIMLLRGRDKLVVAGEGGRIRTRVIQVHASGENSFDVLDFFASVDSLGDVSWFCTSDNQRVNPELVARYYLSPFLALGSGAYSERMQPEVSAAEQAVQ